jgi:hypothetical protein
MSSSGMLRRVALVRTEDIASIMRVTRIGELGTSAVNSSKGTLLSVSVATYC